MRAAANCALANRQIITALVRQVFQRMFCNENLPLLYDVSHNLCQAETFKIDGVQRELYVHRKGATRALPPGHRNLPKEFKAVGQPVLVGAQWGRLHTCWRRLAMKLAFSSACHGAGRRLSRTQARKQWAPKY